MSSEAGHFYHKDGTPAYTISGKNGKERATTVRDAKKLGLVPSVTTIIRCADAPGLTNWRIDQAILSALTLPRIEGEDETAYLSRIKLDAQEQAKKAAERGTQIHAWVQGGFEGDCPPEGIRYFKSALDTIEAACGDLEWVVERPFANPEYGGKVDLQSDVFIIDIKTKDKDISNEKLWDSHIMQLAAYDCDCLKKCGILFINSITAESKIVWATQDELYKGWKMFNALLEYYYAKNGMEAS